MPAPPDVLILPAGLAADELPLEQITLWGRRVILFPVDATDLPLIGEHPIDGLLQGYPLVTTQSYGWIRVSSDGHEAWVRAEK